MRCNPEPVTVQEIKVFSREIPDREIKLTSNGHIAEDVKCITPADIIASVNYFLELQEGVGNIDDIDHLGNRRIRRLANCCKTRCGSVWPGWNGLSANVCQFKTRLRLLRSN